MKKRVLFVLMSCICGISLAQITISKDKPLHFGAGFGIGAVGGYTAHQLFNGNPYWTWAGAVGSSIGAGLVKETMDKADYGIWDNSDIVFTTLGGIASAVVLELFLKKSKKRKRFGPCNCYAVKLDFSKDSQIRYIDVANSRTHDIMAALQAQRILEMPSLE
ncbi:hypothetical protein [Maribacter sp. HTCC2170]|uniref:hypothetical protein n=1 Tax=Maribacter sp. (strain HTCC2170 / KCCM 42371) TaxID=313603 RepID=UPI00006B4897|nr:hypothetical protein [Maribacter sp. HTCC2170]EAR01958.1 hypothetical protein FB2170_15558 [Maribacter sp. HTCC2170]